MAIRVTLAVAMFGLILSVSGCSKSDSKEPEGYNKQQLMRQKPTFSASGQGAPAASGPAAGTSVVKKVKGAP